MTIEEALAILDKVLQAKRLNNLQELVFRGVWQGQSYQAIAQSIDYEPEYIKQIGAQIWQLLTQALGEKVTKSNIQSILRRYQDAGEFLELSRTPQLPTQTLKSINTATHSQSVANGVSTIPNRQDWGEAIDASMFFGRTAELAMLQQWILDERCRLVVLLGMGGIGKTSLSVKLAQQIQGEFEYLIWRSLRNAPPVLDILAELIQFLGNEQETELPSTLDKRILRLMHYLRNHRCLVILDNAESILQECDRTGRYLEGYEGYEQLFNCVGETFHQSCLVLTSREKPKGVAAKEGETLPIRSLSLKGLSPAEARQVFQAKGTYIGSDSEWDSVISHYAGNPLALKMIAPAIQDFFEGSVSKFVNFFQQDSLIFDDIRDLLGCQFNRITDLEQEIMYWLAIERKPVVLGELQDDFVARGSPTQLLDALVSLQRRSFIEKSTMGFTQQPVVMEYMTLRLVEQVCQEIATEKIGLLMSHALIKATTKDYIRESQIRLILEAIAKRLRTNLTFPKGLEHQLKQLIWKLKQRFSDSPGYGGGNLINLLNQLKINLANYDFSNLAIWQADLRQVNCSYVNFSYCDLAKSVFAETFSGILTVAISPCGNLLATGDVNGEVRLWQVADGKQLFTLKGHSSWVWSVCWSPDGHTLASSSDDCTVRLWDVQEGRCVRVLRGHSSGVGAVTFSPDGRTLASSSDDASVRLWHVGEGRCIRVLSGHTNRVRTVAWSPHDRTLASGSFDLTVRVWDVQQGNCLTVLSGHRSGVGAVAFNPDGRTLASGSEDQTVRVWNVQQGNCLKVLSGHSSGVGAVAFSPDGRTLATASEDQTVRVWNVLEGNCLKVLSGHTSRVWSLCWSPDGRTLASGSDDSSVRLWDVQEGKYLKVLYGYTSWVCAVAWSPIPPNPPYQGGQGGILASGSDDSSVRLWDIHEGKCLKVLPSEAGRIWSVCWSPDGCTLASGGDDSSVRLWDVHEGKCLKVLPGHAGRVWSVAFSSDGRTVASGSYDQTVRLWDVIDGHCLNILSGHASRVRAVAFSPNSTNQEGILASGGDDSLIRLWDVSRGKCLKTLQGHTNWVSSVAWSPDGNTLASGSFDQTVRVWDVREGCCVRVLPGHASWISAVAWSPDGRTLVSSSDDQTMKLWDVSTGGCITTLQGHRNGVLSVAFSSDGMTLASGSQDETIKLWDIKTGECLKTLRADRLY
ncbi:MAG TPA: NB-ARC domain-containing protein, partial [Stenomitos sp.]